MTASASALIALLEPIHHFNLKSQTPAKDESEDPARHVVAVRTWLSTRNSGSLGTLAQGFSDSGKNPACMVMDSAHPYRADVALLLLRKLPRLADIEHQETGRYPIHDAAEGGLETVIDWLLSSDSDQKYLCTSRTNETPAKIAAAYGNEAMFTKPIKPKTLTLPPSPPPPPPSPTPNAMQTSFEKHTFDGISEFLENRSPQTPQPTRPPSYGTSYFRQTHSTPILNQRSSEKRDVLNVQTAPYHRPAPGTVPETSEQPELPLCIVCHVLRVENPRKKACNLCFKNNAVKMRRCQGCQKDTVPFYEEEWKNTCVACFRARSQKQESANQGNPTRVCSKCNHNKLPAGAESWRTMCGACYRASR